MNNPRSHLSAWPPLSTHLLVVTIVSGRRLPKPGQDSMVFMSNCLPIVLLVRNLESGMDTRFEEKGIECSI